MSHPNPPKPLESVRKSVVVARSAADAFAIFTERMGEWWPFAGHSLLEGGAQTVVFEPRVGGVVCETSADGRRAPWGRVLAWDPPRRFVMTWHPGREEAAAQELEVRFVPEGAGTRVELEHRGWEALLDQADATRQSYDGGWLFVLDRYVACTAGGGR